MKIDGVWYSNTWNFDDHGLRQQETKNNNRNLTHIVVRYEAIQNIKKPGGATERF